MTPYEWHLYISRASYVSSNLSPATTRNARSDAKSDRAFCVSGRPAFWLRAFYGPLLTEQFTQHRSHLWPPLCALHVVAEVPEARVPELIGRLLLPEGARNQCRDALAV